MKTIEEKAKAYDEALRKAKEGLDSLGDNYICNHLTKDDIREMYANFFPELKENEVDRIRKALIKLVKKAGEGYENVIDGVSIENAIYWLEKQGKKEWSNEMGSLCLEACSLLRAYSEEIPYNSQLGQKIKRVEAFLGDLYHEAFYPSTYNPRPDIISPEWSYKDETIIKTMCNEGNLKPSERQWLNNLCYRVKQQKLAEQKPTEWSEEDEDMLQNILECLRHGWKKTPTDILNYENWLKSLRPQNTWKPSEEQMKALWNVYQGGKEQAELATLYTDLKKLRNE